MRGGAGSFHKRLTQKNREPQGRGQEQRALGLALGRMEVGLSRRRVRADAGGWQGSAAALWWLVGLGPAQAIRLL